MGNALAKEKNILIHRIFGHPSFLLLKNIYPILFGNYLLTYLCDACRLVKLKRNSYPMEEKRYQIPFQLVHYDI